MQSLKIQAVVTLLNDTDFSVEVLQELQKTIEELIKNKFQVALSNRYYTKLEEYPPDLKEILRKMLEESKFRKHDSYLLVAEHLDLEYSVEKPMRNTSLRMYNSKTSDNWWLGCIDDTYIIHGHNIDSNERINNPSVEICEFAKFLLKSVS